MNLKVKFYNRSITEHLCIEELNSCFCLLISSMYLGRTCFFETHEETGTEASTVYWILVIFRASAQKKHIGKEEMKYKRKR